jgi:two-component system sensor histidine kinase YesM
MKNTSIRTTIFIYFTLTALAASVFIGISFYTRLSGQMSQTIREESQILVNQTGRSMDSYLRTIMKLSDSLYYGVVKNADLSDASINAEMTLLYDNNKDNLENIALFSKEGQMLESVPAARLKPTADVTGEPWFLNALSRTENLHFSTPHVQSIFDANENQYKWVVTLSRAVEITRGPDTDQGVLLIDIRYNSLEQLMDGVALGNGGYVYLISNDGELIYHPKAQLINSGRAHENHLEAAAYKDGNHEDELDGVRRLVTVKTVGYTGWKIVGVTPLDQVPLNNIKTQLLMVFIVLFVIFILTIINSYISRRITDPIKELEKYVKKIEDGQLDAQVYTGGSYEISHLGTTVGRMARQIKRLMDDIVVEHESKRRNEFDTLQSQINPHFLYNTLDVIVWMIENEKQADAVKAVTALARFFRISLSGGRSIIPVQDELEHVRNYLMIQHMRYKNRFSYSIEAGDDVPGLASLKLVLQPLVENAIYHGMEFMDGDGEITVRAWREGNDLYLSVADNGLGMTQEQAAQLFAPLETAAVREPVSVGTGPAPPSPGAMPSPGATAKAGASGSLDTPSSLALAPTAPGPPPFTVTPPMRSARRGSGIGVRNVNERIKLYFGPDYGLSVETEPDMGTTVIAHMPAIPYNHYQEHMGVQEHAAARGAAPVAAQAAQPRSTSGNATEAAQIHPLAGRAANGGGAVIGKEAGHVS